MHSVVNMEFMKKLFQPLFDEICVKTRLYQIANNNEAIQIEELKEILLSCTQTPNLILDMLIKEGILEPIKNNNEYMIVHKK